MTEFVLIIILVMPIPDAAIIYHPQKFGDENECREMAQMALDEMGHRYQGMEVEIMGRCVPFKAEVI